jgi:Carboxypeptidase regulatory-like domain/TonB dependent receptor
MNARRILILVLVQLMLSHATRAQSTFGDIVGMVQDQSLAAIPGSMITLQNVDENITQSTVSDASGAFQFLNLKPGRYTIVASLPGFADYTLKDISLEARQVLRVTAKLVVASVAESVQVNASALVANTENATLADSKIMADIVALPLNSRAVSTSPLAALATSPNVVKDSQGNISIGGATASMVGFSVDGISTANVRQNGALQNAYPSLEAIREMKVTGFNNNAEFAQVGDVTFTTKSGTERYRGSLFEYFQSDALDAPIYGFTDKAPKQFNTFGGSVGGPVVLPGLSTHEATFFFLDYEGNRKSTSTPELLLVPTAAARSGNLSALAAPGTPVMDPFTGLPYANNTIPSGGACASARDCVNPVAQGVLQYYPLPNANLNVTNPSYNYQTLAPIPSNSNAWDLRVDHSLTTSQQVYGRFSSKDNSAQQAIPFLPNVTTQDRNRSLLVSHNYVKSSTLLNEFRFGFTNFNEDQGFPIQGSAAIAQLGLQGVDVSQHPTGHAFPTFSFSDGSISSIGQNRVGATISQTTQFADNLTKASGKHTFKFGADVRMVHYNALMFFQPSDDYGDFTFSPGLYTNYSLGDFLLGLPQQSFFAVTSPQVDARSTQWGVYAQDEWHANSHLTVNVGLRWELHPPFVESQGDLGSFDPRTNSVLVPDAFLSTLANNPSLQPAYTAFLASFNACSLVGRNTALPCSTVATASQDGVTQGLRQLYRRDFDPRVSIAYRPFDNDRTVIRSGFGIFTMTTLGPMSFNNAGNPTSALTTNVNAAYAASGALLAPQFQFPNTAPTVQTVTYGGGSLEQANNPQFKDPQSAQWNVTLEREIGANTLMRLSYVGMRSYWLPVTVDLNQIPASTTPYTVPAGAFVDPRAPYQNWFLLMSAENAGSSTYHALQAQMDHRLSHGLAIQANYTYAQNLSDAQGDAPTAFASEVSYAAEVANRFNIEADRGNVVGTPRHRLLVTGTYLLPFGADGSGLWNALRSGWTISTVTTIQTGQWLTPTINPTASNSFDPTQINDQSNTNVANRAGALLRPDCVGNPVPANQSPAHFFDINAFSSTPPGAGRFGSCGVGILEGPGLFDVDLGVFKQVKLGDRVGLRVEATFTNVLNHINFAPPSTNISNPATFGILQAVLPPGAGGNRTGQVAARLTF